MAQTRLFKNGNSQAVRIPAELAFTSWDLELEIERGQLRAGGLQSAGLLHHLVELALLPLRRALDDDELARMHRVQRAGRYFPPLRRRAL